MNKFIATFCIIGTALALSACHSASYTHHSGASFAHQRTAGMVDGKMKKSYSTSDRVFRRVQSK
ncbi:MAG: hypothetical protein AAF182_00065 [Pseudomonadota bacterium]